MTDLVAAVAARLGLGARATATPEEVLAALDRALTARELDRVPVEELLAAPVALVDRAAFEQAQTDLAAMAEAGRQRALAPARQALDVAVREGRLSPFERAGFDALLAEPDADAVAAAQLVARQVGGMTTVRFPVEELGYVHAPGTPVDSEAGVRDDSYPAAWRLPGERPQ